MDDTTHEAPERIWVDYWLTGKKPRQVTEEDLGGCTEYVRADLVQAAVAAALREAAEQAEEWGAIVDHPSVYMGGPSRNAQRIAKGFAEEILALITPDAQAALDRYVKQIIRSERSE